MPKHKRPYPDPGLFCLSSFLSLKTILLLGVYCVLVVVYALTYFMRLFLKKKKKVFLILPPGCYLLASLFGPNFGGMRTSVSCECAISLAILQHPQEEGTTFRLLTARNVVSGVYQTPSYSGNWTECDVTAS